MIPPKTSSKQKRVLIILLYALSLRLRTYRHVIPHCYLGLVPKCLLTFAETYAKFTMQVALLLQSEIFFVRYNDTEVR
jgi:hypothetical protein